MYRVNIGCGMTPTEGWMNFDNSPSLKLSSFPRLAQLLFKAKLIKQPQMALITFGRMNKIIWADGAKKIPLPDDSVEVLYSSHMLEHLDPNDVKVFINESKRSLKSGGIIRLAVPDIEGIIRKYNADGDANAFIESTCMCVPRPRTFSDRLRMLLVGPRHHQWMYDKKSLCRLLSESGFINPVELQPGFTTIREPGALNLNERMEESLYVEATKA